MPNPGCSNLLQKIRFVDLSSLHTKTTGTATLRVDLYIFSSEVALHSLTTPTTPTCVQFVEMKTYLQNSYFFGFEVALPEDVSFCRTCFILVWDKKK